MVGENDLKTRLGIDGVRLESFIKAGLPCEQVNGQRLFLPEAVADWLIDNGYAVYQVATTRAQVANHFGVTTRTIAYWSSEGMPGEPGSYDLAAIEEWRQQKRGESADQNDSERGKIMAVDRQLKELKLRQQLGEVAPVDPLLRRMERRIHEAKAILNQIPELVVAVAVEEGFPADAAGRLRLRVLDVLHRTYGAIADTARLEDGETETEYDDQEV